MASQLLGNKETPPAPAIDADTIVVDGIVLCVDGVSVITG